MQILIHKDSATKVPKEVTEEQAADYAKQFTVEVVNEDGTVTPYQPQDVPGYEAPATPKAEAAGEPAPVAPKKKAAGKL